MQSPLNALRGSSVTAIGCPAGWSADTTQSCPGIWRYYQGTQHLATASAALMKRLTGRL